MKSSNIYIDVLRYGAENLNRGITYAEAIRQLGSRAPKGDFELYFNNWFYDNFHSESIPELKRKQSETVILTKEELNEANNQQVFLTSAAYFKLMSFSNDNVSKETVINLIFSSVAFVISLVLFVYVLFKF
jgi:hypothetical protein